MSEVQPSGRSSDLSELQAHVIKLDENVKSILWVKKTIIACIIASMGAIGAFIGEAATESERMAQIRLDIDEHLSSESHRGTHEQMLTLQSEMRIIQERLEGWKDSVDRQNSLIEERIRRLENSASRGRGRTDRTGR